MRFALLVGLLVFCAFPGRAQQLMFQKIGVRGGLPATEVYNLLEDDKGYVWVFTEYGIVKYNGSKFVPVCTNLPLKQSSVYAVTKSASGRIYFVNSQVRLFYVENDKAFEVSGLDEIRKVIKKEGMGVFMLKVLENGTIVMSNANQTFQLKKGSYWAKHLPKELCKYKKKEEFVIRKNATIDSTNHSALGFYFTNGKRATTSTVKKIGHARAAFGTFGNRAYLGLNKTVHYTDQKTNGNWKSYVMDAEIIGLRISDNGHIWVCTSGAGLQEFDPQMRPLHRYLEKETVSDVLFDSQSGMWASTIGSGVFHCNNINRFSYENERGIRKISMVKKAGGKLFIGTSTGRTFVFDGKLRELQYYDHAPISDVTFFKGKYYIGSKAILREFSPDFKHVENLTRPYELPPYSMVSDGSKFMIAAVRRYVDFDPEKGSFRIFGALDKKRSIVQRRKDEYFSVTPYGIEQIYRDRISYPSYLNALREKTVARLKVDRKQRLWVCTKGYGLYCLNPNNTLVHYNRLPAMIVNDITFTGKFAVLSTNQGVFATRCDQMNNLRSWRLILTEEVTQAEYYGDRLYFGSNSGVTVIPVDQLFYSKRAKFYLNAMHCRSKAINLSAPIYLGHNDNDLHFDFDILDFQSGAESVSYKLSGPTKLNGTVEGTNLHVQNLSPGKYVLEAHPELHFDDGSRLKVQTAFEIYPAFWQTLWFRIVMIIVVLIFIVAMTWWFIRRRNQKRKADEAIEKLLTEYRLTALKAQVNPHFMSNTLAAVQHLILSNEIDKAGLYVAKFSLLLRSLLDYSNKSAASLKNELEMIGLYVELEQLRFNDQFSFDLQIDPAVDFEDTLIPALITQPFVENAIWHGLLPLKGLRQPELKLKVYLNGDLLVISIIDNGVGRNETQMQSKARASKGTALIMSRVENLNQLHKTTGGEIRFTDLKDTNGNGAGTIVDIILPMSILEMLDD